MTMKKTLLLSILLSIFLLSHAQVNLDSGLIANFPFFGNADDVSGNENNGTVLGPILTVDRFGNTDAAYSFSNTTDEISTATYMQGLNVFSISVWFKTQSTNGKIMGFETSQTGSSGQYDRHFYLNNGLLYFGVWNSGANVIHTDFAVSDNLWHNAIATLSSEGQYLYLDGILISFNQNVTSAENFAGYWRMGYGNLGLWTDYSISIVGSIDDVRIYNRALNEEEITTLFNDTTNITNGIHSMSPKVAYTSESYTDIAVFAYPIDSTTQIKLVNETDTITPDSILSRSTFRLTTRFSWDNKTSDTYDVVLVSSINNTLKLESGFKLIQLTKASAPLDTDNDGFRNISTFANLAWVFETDSSWSYNYELDNDIDASESENWYEEKGFNPITNFSGIIDGQSHKIKYLHFNRTDENNIAFIGQLNSGGIVRNLGLTHFDIQGNNYVAAIVGNNSGGIIQNCYATGSISGNQYVAGITGYNTGTVKACYNSALANGVDNIGGIVGEGDGSSIISKSYNLGKIIGSDLNVGGIIGANSGIINDCYNSGSVIGAGEVAGISGRNYGTITNVYNRGYINGTGSYCGAINGYGWGSITNAYWDIENSGLTTSNGGTSKTSAEMKTQSTYADWDFDDTWEILSTCNDGYPQLSWSSTTSLISSYSPEKVANRGTATITFEGINFDDSTKVYLYKAGQDTLVTDTIYTSDTYCTAQFDFDGAELGDWNILVEYPDTTVTIRNGITIEEKNEVKLDVSIIGPSKFRKGRPVTYTILVENKSNSTVYSVPLGVTMSFPDSTTISNLSLDGNISKPSIPDSILAYYSAEDQEIIRDYYDNFEDIDYFFAFYDSTDANYYLKNDFYIGSIAPNSSYTMTVTFTAIDEVKIQVAVPKTIDNDFYSESYNSKTYANKSYSLKTTSTSNNWDACCTYQTLKCLISIIGEIPAIKNSLAGFDLECIYGVLSNKIFFVSDIGCDMADNNEAGLLSDITLGFYNSTISSILACSNLTDVRKFFKGLNIFSSLLSTGYTCVQSGSYLMANCFDDPSNDGIKPEPVNSLDPNDKYGYRSPSGSTYFNKDQTNFTYLINFENKDSATAAAQEVFVTDTLDLNSFDIESFKAGYIKIGENIYNAPLNVQDNKWTIDMRPDKDLITYVTLSLNKEEGIAKWYFRCVDPETMEWPEDVTAGFLPPNDSLGSGEGSVMFTIDLLDSLVDDASISNKATIVFDNNEPIVTPTWTNTKDIVAPESYMEQPEIIDDTTALLIWNGIDNSNGSGVYCYNLFVKEGDGDYVQLLSRSSLTTLEYAFKNDVEYSLYVTAVDSAGNAETKTNVPDITLLQQGTGINDISNSSKNSMTVYPNPLSENQGVKVRVKVEYSKNKELVISSVYGSIVETIPFTGNELEVKGLNNGMYIFTLRVDNRNVISQKVVITQ
jgi:hypothetical protein